VTFSIVARSDEGDHWGVAVASKFLAVGAAVPAARAGVGALATQAWANLAYRPNGLALLADGRAADEVVAALTGADKQRDDRQLGVVDVEGRAATFTGASCFDWAGGVTLAGAAIQGNILVGPEVVESMADAWRASDPAAPLARRLLSALAAGDLAGGDARGRQSAALLVVTAGGGYGGGSDVLVDLRVDDHAEPVPELGRLLGIHDLLFGRPDPEACLPLDDAVADELRRLLRALGYVDADLETALAAYSGVENLEERLVPGRIDPVVLDHLRAAVTPTTD
jgi:uncharacterized Ntn-hydrolase superfamily protein